MLDAVGQVEPGRPFGESGPMPRPLTTGDCAASGVEGADGDAEFAHRPRPLRLDQPQQVQEVLRRVRGASASQLITSSSSDTAASPAPACRARASPRNSRATATG